MTVTGVRVVHHTISSFVAWSDAMWLGGGCSRSGFALVVAAAGVWLATSARADEPAPDAIVVSVLAPAECPDRDALERGVRARVTPPPDLDLRARVEIVQRGAELAATLEIERASGTAMRRLHDPDCRALAEAITLVIAMAIDPDAALREPSTMPRALPEPLDEGQVDPSTAPGPSPDPAPPDPAPPDPAPSAPALPDPAPPAPAPPDPAPPASAPAPSHLSFLAEASFTGGAGLLPSISYGALALVGLRIEGFELALGGDVLAESRAQLASSTRGGDFGTAAGRLRLSYAFDLAPFELAPTLAIDVGATWGRGFGVTTPGAGTALSVSLALGGLARWFFLPELGLTLFAELVVPFLRPEFILTGVSSTAVFRANDVGTLFGLGLVLRIR